MNETIGLILYALMWILLIAFVWFMCHVVGPMWIDSLDNLIDYLFEKYERK